MMLRPLENRIIVRPDIRPTETASGLHLVETWVPEQTGTVIAVGDRLKEPDLVKVGDAVIFSWSAGHELFVNDGEDRLIVLREPDLLAVIESSEPEHEGYPI